MTQVEAKPCLDSVVRGLHEFMTKKARRKDDIVRGDYLDLVHEYARRKAVSVRDVSDAMSVLLDTVLEKVDGGFLVTEKFSELAPGGFAAPANETHYARSAWGGEDASRAKRAPLSSEAAGRPASDSYAQSEIPKYEPEPRCPRSRVVVLARTTFPSLCREAGIQVNPVVFSWRRLAKGINRWQEDYGVDLNFVRQMMLEFVRHPEWCDRSRRCPDEVFISRREKLATLVLAQRKRDPGNRRHSGGAEYWWGSKT